MKYFFHELDLLELPPGVYNKVDKFQTSKDLVNINVVIAEKTLKTRMNSNNILAFDEKSFFNFILDLTPKWDYMLNQKNFSQKTEA